MAYEPLETMVRTGDAIVDHEGVMISSGEYVAALYESYAADCEPTDTSRTDAAYAVNVSLNAYANAAARSVEDLWQRDVEMYESARDHAYDSYVFENSTI